MLLLARAPHFHGDTQPARCVLECSVRRPEIARGEEPAPQEVNVDPTQAPAKEAVLVNEVQQFGVIGDPTLGQRRQEPQDLAPIPEAAASQLANDKGMAQHLSGIEHRRKPGFPPA